MAQVVSAIPHIDNMILLLEQLLSELVLFRGSIRFAVSTHIFNELLVHQI